MKKIIYICLLMPLVFQSCKKAYSPGDNYPIVNVLPPYAAFKSLATVNVKLNADHVTPGAAAFTFLIRTALQQTVTVTYSVSGAITLTNQTAVIPRDATTVAISVPVPAGTAPGTATIVLNKAVAADGTVFTIGQDNVAANQKASIKITQL
ncbi:hypothetical protein [Mucilaginibacter sp. UR6-11]|uniref:hypothetical protein n=1 Tax=Mucilaginibacter sp. UR6-11 TaxID=1435644 RepID=UPI001E2F44A3|nr:hypothetical protein [Mucilaginibacter sp. UR6-11]MCC8424398.1 hypothetical protein [Mucilaginibacter sp. UR6-11]